MNPNPNAFRSVYEPTSVAGVAVPAQVHRRGLAANDMQTSGSLPPQSTFDGRWYIRCFDLFFSFIILVRSKTHRIRKYWLEAVYGLCDPHL